MADKIQKIQITLPNGKQQWVTIPEFNNNRSTAYANAMVRMVDNEGNEYDVEKNSLNKASKLGLRPFIFADNAPQSKPSAPHNQQATAKPQSNTSQPSSRNVAPTPSYQDLISGDYWSKQLGAKPKQDILPTQNKVGLDLPDFGKQDEYVNRTADVLYNEQQKFAKSEEDMKRIQAQLAEANKRAEALKKQISDENQRRQDSVYVPTYSGFNAQLPQNINQTLAKKLEQEQDNIAKLSAQLNENEYFKRNLSRLEGVASDLENQASKEMLTQEENKSWLSALTTGRDVMRGTYGIQHNEKMNQASAIRENVRETRRMLREASLNNDSFYNKLGRGFRDAFLDINTWDMGVNAVRNSATTLLAKNNIDKGNETVPNNAVLESAAIKNAASQKTKNAISAWYNAGITTTNMIPFMAYIYSSPFNNIGKGLSSSISKMLTQNVEGALLQRMLPQVVYRASVNGLKGIGRFAGDVLGGSATALTFANQNILSDALNRYQGQHTGQFTPDGRFVYTGSQNEKGVSRSLLEAFATQAIEYQSELVGEYFTPLNRLLFKGLGKTVGYGTKEMFDAAGNKITSRFFGLPGHKISLDKTVDLFSRLTNAECLSAWNKFAKATKFNGIIGEYLEEVVGNMENATLGINDANWGTGEGGVFNPKENMETFLAVAVGSGFMAGLAAPMSIVHKASINRAYNRANADGIVEFNLNAWQAIREQIDNAPVPELPTIVLNLMEEMNDKQKKVIQNYAAFSVAKQGSLMADFKEQLEKPHIARVGTSVEISADGTERYFVKSMDEQNGLLSTKEFRSEEDANAYKARVEEYINNGRNVQVLNQLLSTDEGLQSAEQIAADMGEPISYISELFYTDPLKRTDTEQAIVDEFVSRANNVAFPPTDVNENHEVQNGQDIAEGTEIGDQQAIDTINQREANAISAWNEIDDPDLKNFVATLTENGSTPNQIVEWLRYYEYPEDVIAAFCELCNAKAEKEGYINRTGQKIEEQVAQQVKQNTFAGTFNDESTPIILEVQDVIGRHLYTVGGNISIDEQGILSSDGLVVLRDEQGNFIQLPNLQGLTLVGTYSVEDYTNYLLTQTQEAVTAQIQSTESQEQPTEEKPTEEQQPETQQQQEQKPTIPVDKDGKKLYTQAPVEDTIADITSELGGDMENVQSVVRTSAENANARLKAAQEKKKKGIKGKDPQEMIANANKLNQEIADAQAEADYWNNALNQIAPQQQATEEPASQEPSVTQEQPTEEQPQPIDETTIPIEQRAANMYGKLEDEEVRENLDTKISELTKQLSKLPKKPKMVADENVYLQEKEKLNAQRQELQKKLDYWTAVKDYIQKKTKTTPEDIKAAQDELSGTNARLEYAAQQEQGATTPLEIAGEFVKNAKIIPSDFYAETGMQAADARKQFPGMLSNNGSTIARLAEQLVQHDNDNYGGRFFKGDDMEARNYIIQALTGAESRKALGRNMTAEEKEYVRQAEEQREDFHQEAYGMSYSDYLAFEEQQMPYIWRLISNFAPEQYDQMVAEYYESLPEDYFTQQNQNNNGTEQQNPTVAGSNEILPQPPVDNEKGSGQRQDPAAEEGNGGKGDNTNDEVSGDALNDGSYQLSDELDENGRQFVLNSKGGLEFGYISDETGLKPAPILLSEGIITNRQTGDGYGLVHIEFRHGDQIRNAGYKSVLDFIEEVGNNYEVIREGKDRLGNQTYLLQLTDKHNNTLIVELSGDGSYWNINTAGIFKRNYARNNKEVYNRHTTTKQSVETAEASQGAEQSDTQTPSSMNAPTPSEGKDTTKSPNSQENQQKTDKKSDEGQKDNVNAEIKKDIEAFIAESTHDVEITNYNEEDYEAQISVDGKPSNIVVTPPMEMEEGMHAEYRPENSSYQELGDLLDEYNETVDRKDQGLDGEHLAAIFSSVDAAIAFEKWMEQRKVEQSNLPTHSQFVLYKNNAAGNYATVSGNPQSGYVVRYFADKADISEDLQSGLSIGESMLTPQEFKAKLDSGELERGAIYPKKKTEQEQEKKEEEKKEEQPATVPDNSVVGQSQFPFTKEELEAMTKEQMISAMWQKVFPVVCEKYKVPSDTMDENAYWFAPKMTKGYPKDSLVAACMKYMEHLNDEVAQASEKQMNYIMSLAAEDEKRLFRDITLTKTAASRVINLFKQEEEMINSGIGSKEEFDEIANELEKIARLNGADLSQKDQKKAEKPWDEMTEKEKMDYAFSQPLLTEEQIKNAPTDEVNKANALAFIKGQKGKINSLSYYLVYKDVKLSTGSSSADNAADDTAQLDEANSGSSRGRRAERKHSGLRNRRVDTEGGGQQDPNQDGQQLQRGENGEGRPSDNAGETGDMEVPGDQQPVGRRNPGDSQSGRGSVSDRNGHNVSQQGGNGRSRKNPNTDRRGSDKANGRGTTSNAELNSQDIDSQLQKEIDTFKSLLSDYRETKNKKNGNIYATVLPGLTINTEKIEAWGRLIYQGAKVGYLILRKGHTSLSEWSRIMKDMLTPAMHEIEVSDLEIDEFIKEMWHCNLPIGDEIHTIAEWSKIMQEEKLRSAIKQTLEEKRKKQLEAEPIEVKITDKNNIAETLPYLLPLQHDDVYKAEMQFFDESHNDDEHANGKGFMFTNGTGTGKTYTGLGIAKRFIKQGKKRILILTPSTTKVKDWVLDAANLNIEAYNLDDWAKAHGATATTSKGEGLVVTTYANFRQNQALLEDEFDLVIYDESHRLLENKKGGETEGSKQHYMLTNKDENWAFNRLQLVNPIYQAIQSARREFDAQYDKEKAQFQDAQEARFMLPNLSSPIAEFAGYPKLKEIRQKYYDLVKQFNDEVKPQLEEQAKESVKKTKVVFLSATPFNTRENLGYAEGYIFRYPKTYTRIGPRSQFYLDNFGAAYRWRNNRLEARTTNPEAVTRQEIAFSDYLQNQLGTMSGRVIDSEFDYSRDFPTVTFEKAEELNNAFEEIKKMEGNIMRKAFYEVMYNYQYTSVLFEAMKTSCILPRMKQHLEAGRKIVLFHRRMETASPITPPFREMLNKANALVGLLTSTKEKNEAKAQIADFEQRFADMLEWEQTIDLRVPRVQILEAFGEEQVLLFSGKETTKQKNAAVDEFNSDASKKKIIVIQEASGKEGISLHDKTGKNQRVLISLAMPQSPITALQVEGRIYRIGNKSNAIFEYPLLGLDEELITWGQRFNTQVGTTENLALGSKARNLRESFAKAVIEHSGDVPLESQGIGGKEMDEAISQDQTDPFDKAVLDFYGNAKTSGKRDNREGKDYYPTPEPLGFMMVEWANLSEGESVLEPSAGHGAIARYVPSSNQLTSVEPSTTLFGRLQVLAGGIGRKFENDIFENYNIVNKHDVVLMNPPFGTAGRLAIDHVAKAFKHLSEGGRIVAIIPRGSADAKFDKWIETEKTAAVVGEIQLPNITFQNAGTQVACRVVIIDKISNEQMRNEALNNAKHIELPNNYAKIEDFFEDLRGITMPARTIDQKSKNDKKLMPIIKELKDEDNGFVVEFTPTGVLLSGVGFDYLSMPDDLFKLNMAAQYARANKQIQYIPARMTRMIAAYEAIKKMALKLADMSEEEMNDFVAKNIKNGAPKKSIAEQFKYEVKKNTRTGEDMYVVSKASGVNLTEDEYNSARSSAKSNGGYWSRYAGGFVFPSEVAAKTFLGGGYTNSEDNTTRLAYSNSTNNVNNSRIIPEDVDKDVSLQIESEFDSAIESLNLTEGEKAELDKKIRDYSNSSTIELEDIFYINNSRLGLRNEKKDNFSEMLWRRGSAVSSPTTNAGGNIRNEKSGAEATASSNGEYSPMVSRRGGETEGANTARGNEVQGQYNGPRDIRNTSGDRLLLQEGRRIEEKVVSQTPRTELSSNQRRLLAAQYAISRELVYRDIRLAALKESLGLQEGKPTSLDEIAAIFEKTNTDQQVKALFDKILAVNKRLGTSIEVAASDVNNNSGSAGTRRDVHYYLDGFTRTSAGKIQVPVVLAHELLHQGTIGAINLVRKGKAEGVLTKEQIDAVNTILDIYNKVKADSERLSESKRGLVDPYEFAAQMVDPRQRKALSMSPLQRIMAAANELKAQGDTSLWNRIKNALKTLFGLSDLKKMDNAINTLLDTFNETVHDISMTDVDQNGWGYTSAQLFDKYPTWLSGQTTGTGQHTTQITSTVNTYKKIGDWMKSQGMDGASVLDASSGLGKGTEALREMGFNVEDVEPYPSENRTAPTYLKYENIKGKYDVVISNAVLNVIPDDWRADVLKNMADKVKPGGKMIINVRDAKEMEKQKQKIELDSPSEILVTDKAGNIRAYQKGFTQKELADWIQSELGEGWTIETAKPSNSGISGRAVVVTRNTESPLRYRKVTDSMQPTQANQEKQSQMRAHAQAVAEKLNTKLTFTTSDKLEGEKKRAKGWYNKKTGQVVIVLDNNKDNFDIEQTVIHEVVGHKGLRALLGAKGLYRLLDSIYANLDEQAKQAIDEKTMRNGWQKYTAIEEYLAEQAEKTVWDSKSASLWQNVKHYLTEALRTLGFMISPNLKDVRYWIWLSKNNLKRNNVMSEIKRLALLNKIEKMGAPVLDLASNEKQDSLSPKVLFRQAVQDDIEHKPLQEAYQDYAISLKDFLKIITKGLGRDLMDNENAYLGENQMGSIASALAQKFVNKQINHLRETIIGLSDVFSDATYQISRTADELYKGGQAIINKCEAYLYTKHGLERNRVLYVRDLYKRIEKIAMNTGLLKRSDIMDIIDKFNEDFQNYKDYLSGELKNHNISFGDYLHSLDDFIKTYKFSHPSANPQPHEIKAIAHLNQWYNQHISSKYDPNKNDMSGLSSFSEYGLGDNFDEQKAIDAVESIEHSIGDKRLEELWKAVQDVTQYAIDMEYKSGMLSKKAYERCKTMFEWYVPLRGVSEDTMEDLYAYLGGGNDNGSAVQTAKGRHTLANTPLATAYGMALQAINSGVRNRNNQRMYRAVNSWLKNNPNKLAPATIVDCWYEIDNNGNFEMKVPNITDNMTPEQITAETQRFEEEMKAKQQQGIAFKKDIKSFHVKPFSKKSHANDHIVYVKVNGVRKMIIFNGDPRPARVLRGEMNPSITKVNDWLRKLSALNTSWNPTFTLKNLSRDTFESYNNIFINENLTYFNKFKSNQLRLMGDGFWAATDMFKKNKSSYLVAFYKWKSGKEPVSYIEKMFFEFMENGGATGFMEYKKMEELQSMLYKNKSVATIAENPFEVFGIAFGTVNEMLENLNRFAVYLTSREMGRSVMTSVNNAKEVTLNFNRRGAGDKTAVYGNTKAEAIYGWTSYFFRNTRMFFNPSVQSLYRILSNHTRHPFKSAIIDVGVFMLLSSAMPLINAFLISLAGDDGDDRYSDLSPWTRRNNICIYNPFRKKWITLPIPPNIAAFYGMGDVAYGYVFDKSFQSGYGVWSDIASQLAMILPFDYIGKNGTIKPLDSIIIEAVVGDVANPILEVALNKDWLGHEIYKDTPWNENDPEWQRCYSNTNKLFVELSKGINSIGNDYEYLKGPLDNRLFNPGIMQHLFESYTGGFGKDLANVVSLAKDFDPNKIPVWRGFVRTPDNTNRFQRVRIKYNVYKDEANDFENNLKKLQKNGDLGDTVAKIKYIGTEEKRTPEYRRFVEFKKKEKYIKGLQEAIKNAKNDVLKDALELELNKTKRDLVDVCDQIE